MEEDRAMRATAVVLLSVASVHAHAQPAPHACAAEALTQARALLVFHSGDASRVEIDDRIRVLAPRRNPVNARQRFDVLEVSGHVYRADYRIRLLYARLLGPCILMGQEVIELSSL